MTSFERIEQGGHELVVLGADPKVGYRGIIAIHNTTLGPAAGGTRFWRYETEAEALEDVLRLSRGMTCKNAMAGLPLGGGKSVIWDQGGDRREVLKAHARRIQELGGRYVTAEDVGTTLADLDIMREVTPHVLGSSSGLGDSAPYTARGVFRAIEAAAEHRWGDASLAGRTVVIQGTGGVGGNLARLLAAAGAYLILADTQPARAENLAAELGGRAIDPRAVYDTTADIFAPCALGGVLNDDSIPKLNVEIIAGGANNQLLEPRHAGMIADRGILYAPDYVANAGGVISGAVELFGWDTSDLLPRIDAIHQTMTHVLQYADEHRITTAAAADRLAEEKLHG